MEKVIYGVNLIVLFLIARFEYNSDSDKTVVIASLGFFVLLVLNLILGFFAQMNKKPIFKHYYLSALGLVVGIAILFLMW
jgi:hypothetical protein